MDWVLDNTSEREKRLRDAGFSLHQIGNQFCWKKDDADCAPLFFDRSACAEHASKTLLGNQKRSNFTAELLSHFRPTTLAAIVADLDDAPGKSNELFNFLMACRQAGFNNAGDDFEILVQRADDLPVIEWSARVQRVEQNRTEP